MEPFDFAGIHRAVFSCLITMRLMWSDRMRRDSASSRFLTVSRFATAAFNASKKRRARVRAAMLRSSSSHRIARPPSLR